MTPTPAEIVEKLRHQIEMCSTYSIGDSAGCSSSIGDVRAAASLIESLTADAERLRGAVEVMAAMIEAQTEWYEAGPGEEWSRSELSKHDLARLVAWENAQKSLENNPTASAAVAGKERPL